MAFSGVIFDLDGTLYAMKKSVRVTTLLNTMPRSRHFFKYLKVRHAQQGKDFGTKEKLLSHINEEMKKAGISEKFEREVFYPAFVKTLSSHRNRPQLITFVKYLKKLGVKTAVFSDYGIIDERLEALGFDKELFDVRVSSEDFGAFKPCSRSFAEVVNKLELQPSQILMVGDRDDTDGEGARSIGMPFFKLNGKSNADFPKNLKTLYSYFQNTVAIPVKRLLHNFDLPVPQRMTIFSAGMDIYAANQVPMLLEPNQRLLVPTGLIFEIPIGYEVQIRPRSGLAFKFGITVLNAPGTIDADYRGEVFVLLINLSDEPFTINRGERIAQAVVAKVTNGNFIEMDEVSETKRGAGGFGHTGT